MKDTFEQIESELETLNACVAELEGLLQRAHAHLEKQQEEWEQSRQDQWRLKKELAALRRMDQEFESLEAENTTLRARQEQLRDGLKRILACTRALGTEYRS